MIINKKAQSTGYAWLVGLVALAFFSGVYIIFDEVFIEYLEPITKTQINASIYINDSVKQELFAGVDEYMAYWNGSAYYIFALIILFMLISAIRKGTDTGGP